MNRLSMAETAKHHWKARYPDDYALMVKHGELDEVALASADLTLMEMETLMLGGMTEHEAWEASRELFVLTKPDHGIKEDVA